MMPGNYMDRLDRNLPIEHLRVRRVPPWKKIPKWSLISAGITSAMLALVIILMTLNQPNTGGSGTLTITVTNHDSSDTNVSLNFFAKQWITQFIAAGDQWSGSFQVNWTDEAPIIGVSATSDSGWHDRKTVQMIKGTVVGVSFVLS
jgi:hypothetical protein